MPLLRFWLTTALAALLLALAVPAHATPTDPVEGVDYVRLDSARPWQPVPGQIEVAEIFSYGCHVCDAFRPMLEAWAGRQGADVTVVHVPAAYRPQDPFATAYFAVQAMGALERTHAPTFDAIHRTRQLPRNASTAELATFYAGLGLDPARLQAAMASDETTRRLNAARDFLLHSGAQGTPTVIINGQYRIQGRSLHDVLRTAEALIARARAAAPAADTASTP